SKERKKVTVKHFSAQDALGALQDDAFIGIHRCVAPEDGQVGTGQEKDQYCDPAFRGMGFGKKNRFAVCFANQPIHSRQFKTRRITATGFFCVKTRTIRFADAVNNAEISPRSTGIFCECLPCVRRLYPTWKSSSRDKRRECLLAAALLWS